MTYAERRHLYILRRAVRRNLRRCHRHSSPTYPPTAWLLPLRSAVARAPSARSCPFLHLSLSPAFPELSPICSLFSFLSLRFCFFCRLAPRKHQESTSFFLQDGYRHFFCQRRFFQSPFDYSNFCFYILDSFYVLFISCTFVN